MPKNKFRINDLFTPQEIRTASFTKTHKELLEKVVLDAMPRINKLTGQENDASYMAYALEYFFAKGS